jgi:hypothetical protein
VGSLRDAGPDLDIISGKEAKHNVRNFVIFLEVADTAVQLGARTDPVHKMMQQTIRLVIASISGYDLKDFVSCKDTKFVAHCKKELKPE